MSNSDETKMNNIVTLSAPLQTHKGSVKELELREPTMGLFVDHGEPFKGRRNGDDIELEFNNKATAAFLAEMTGVDEIILRSLPVRDYYKLRGAMVDIIANGIGSIEGNPTRK